MSDRAFAVKTSTIMPEVSSQSIGGRDELLTPMPQI
jgi:hypothetical protein